jgi:hypothetical protein
MWRGGRGGGREGGSEEEGREGEREREREGGRGGKRAGRGEGGREIEDRPAAYAFAGRLIKGCILALGKRDLNPSLRLVMLLLMVSPLVAQPRVRLCCEKVQSF